MQTEARSWRFVMLLICWLCASAYADAEIWASERGIFNVSFESSLNPLRINRMHEWVLHIETAAGEYVENADISIEGGMPAHDHGLPTQPRVTAYLGNGDYRVKGMRFHMRGEWRIKIAIDDGNKTDSATITLRL